jgi:type VI secretion system protein ImpK
MISATSTNLIVEFFCSFYQTVASLKQAISLSHEMQFINVSKSDLPSNIIFPPENDRVKMIASYLSSVLSENYKLVQDKLTDDEIRHLNVVKYISAALVDELFILEFKWWGNEYWESVLLEQQLFKTCVSGEKFFTILEKLLTRSTGNSAQKELAIVFLMALALGFKGKYRNLNENTNIDAYKNKLLKLIGRKEESLLPMFHNAYDYTIAYPEEKRMSPLTRWYRIGLIFMLIYLILAHFIWIYKMEFINQHFFEETDNKFSSRKK